MSARRVCVVTGSRAEYGLLYWLLKGLRDDPAFELQLVATGMHLAPEFGLTYRAIEQDGFRIDAKVEMLLSSDTAVGIAKSMGLGVIGFADAFDRLRPDLLVLLGDRFEIFAAAQAALVARIPIAHIGGGDTTEGAYDEALRHGITKMAHLHFVTNEDSARRVRQMGEDPHSVFVVGSTGIDNIVRLPRLDRAALEASLGWRLRDRNLLVTFHPVTLSEHSAADQFRELLAALETFGEDVGILFTLPNADNEGRSLIAMVEEFVANRPWTRAFASLGQQRYLSAMALVDAVVGNSSSGLYEAPSFHKPTVNIGERQKGRLKAASVIDCAPRRDAIVAAIRAAFALDCSKVVNPYGRGDASEKILAALKRVRDPHALVQKRFRMLEPSKETLS